MIDLLQHRAEHGQVRFENNNERGFGGAFRQFLNVIPQAEADHHHDRMLNQVNVIDLPLCFFDRPVTAAQLFAIKRGGWNTLRS